MKNDKQNSEKIITYRYKFTFENGLRREFNLKLNADTLNLFPAQKKKHPKWTELK